MSRNHLLPDLKYRGLRFERTASAAFRDASYAAPVVIYLDASLWAKLRRAIRRLVK